MIIPRQYFNQQTPQAQMQQAPMTQAPQRGTADTGRAKAEESLFESMEGLFAKLGGVAGKVEKTNADLEFNDRALDLKNEVNRQLDEYEFNQLPNLGWSQLHEKAVRSYFFDEGKAPAPGLGWSKTQKFSDNERLNRRLAIEQKKLRGQAFTSAVSMTYAHRKIKANEQIDSTKVIWGQELAHAVALDQEFDIKAYEAKFDIKFGFLKGTVLGLQKYNAHKVALRTYLEEVQFTGDFLRDPETMGRLTMGQVIKKYPFVNKIDLLQKWNTSVKSSNTEAYQGFALCLDDDDILPETCQLAMETKLSPDGAINEAWAQLPQSDKDTLNLKLKQKYTRRKERKALLRLEANMGLSDSDIFEKFVEKKNGEYIPNLGALDIEFENLGHQKEAMRIVSNFLSTKEGKEIIKGKEQAERYESKINLAKTDFLGLLNQIKNDPLVSKLDKLRLQKYVEEKDSILKESTNYLYLENNTGTKEQDDKFLKAYLNVYTANGARTKQGRLDTKDEELERKILNSDPSKVHSLRKQILGDARETARVQTLAKVERRLAEATTSKEIEELIAGTADRSSTIKHHEEDLLMAKLVNAKKIMVEKEKEDAKKLDIKNRQLLQLKEINKINVIKDVGLLPTDTQIEALELDPYEKEYIKGQRNAKEVQLTDHFTNENDQVEFEKQIQKALNSKTVEEFRKNWVHALTWVSKIKDPTIREKLETARTRIEKGLEGKKEREDAVKQAAIQNQNYKTIDLAFRNASSIEELGRINTDFKKLSVDTKAGNLTELQSILLEGKFAELNKFFERQSRPADDSPEGIFVGQIKEQLQTVQHSSKIKPILDKIINFNTPQNFPDDPAGWWYELRGRVKAKKQQLMYKENQNKLLKFASVNWEQYIKKSKDENWRKKEFGTQMTLGDWGHALRIAKAQENLATPNWITGSDAIGAKLQTYTNWLNDKIFYPTTDYGNPLIDTDIEGYSVEARIDGAILDTDFSPLTEFAFMLSKGLRDVVLLKDQKHISDRVNRLRRYIKGNKFKEQLFEPFEQVAEKRMSNLTTKRSQTLSKDLLRLRNIGKPLNDWSLDSDQLQEIKSWTDGDTFTLTSGEKIRLGGSIDSAELGTVKGDEVAKWVRSELTGVKVRVERTNRSFNRTVADVFFDDGQYLSQWLVDMGMAKTMTRYKPSKHRVYPKK